MLCLLSVTLYRSPGSALLWVSIYCPLDEKGLLVYKGRMAVKAYPYPFILLPEGLEEGGGEGICVVVGLPCPVYLPMTGAAVFGPYLGTD